MKGGKVKQVQQQQKQVAVEVKTITLELPRPNFGANPVEFQFLTTFNESIRTPDISDCAAFVQWASTNPTLYNTLEETAGPLE